MTPLVAFQSIDTTVMGRFNLASLPDQARMELLVSGFEKQAAFRDENGDFKELSKLDSVERNGDDEVTSIDMCYTHLGGTLDMHYLPPRLERVDMFLNDFEGIIETSLIPTVTRFLRLSNNRFEGSVDLSVLSANIRYLNLNSNLLSGSLDFTLMPDTLKYLNLSKNQFNGEIDVRKVRVGISFDKSGIHNVPFWNNAPIQQSFPMFLLRLSENDFSGTIRVSDIALLDGVGMFANNKCTEIVDRNGQREILHQ